MFIIELLTVKKKKYLIYLITYYTIRTFNYPQLHFELQENDMGGDDENKMEGENTRRLS